MTPTDQVKRAEQLEDEELVQRVEQFEAARAERGEVSLAEFLPTADHPLYLDIAAELIRVDLEHSWASRNPKPLAWYREQWPAVFDDPDALAGVAYEEFRLRLEAGEPVSTMEYQNSYGVDVELWPTGLRQAEPDEVVVSHTKRNPLRYLGGVAEFKPGTKHFGFEIERELGRGASARVFLARQKSLANRHVVLKVSTIPTTEPDRLARLQHNNIVPLLSYVNEGRVNVMCMPFLGNYTLAQWVARLKDQKKPPMSTADFVTTFTRRPDPTEHGAPGAFPQTPVPAKVGESEVQPQIPAQSFGKAWERLRHSPYEQTVLKLVYDLALGLAHAHDHEILHLDIKPGNILMTEDGRPMLLDFHLSTLGDAAAGKAEVEGGTLPYMSPEHLGALVGKGHVDRRSDIYSLGIVLFELLTGKLPFPTRKGKRTRPDRDQVTRVRVSKLTAARNFVPSPRKLRPTLSPGAESIILRCLAPNPDKRYATAHELLEDLERHLHDRPLKFAENTSWKERFTKWRKRHPTLTSTSMVTAISLVLLGVLAAGTVFARKGETRAVAMRTQQFFRLQVPALKAGLYQASMPSQEATQSDVRATLERTLAALKPFNAASRDDWRNTELVQSLPSAERSALEQEIGQLLTLLAKARSSQAGVAISLDGLSAATGKESGLEQSLVLIRRAADALQGHIGIVAAKDLEAQLLRRLGRESEAAAVEAGPENPAELTSSDLPWQALLMALDGDYTKASDLLKEVTGNSPNDSLSWYVAGTCQFSMERFSDAETSFTVCITMQPKSVDAWLQRSICRLQQEEWKGALEDLDRVLELDPTISAAWFNRTLALRGLQRWEDALIALDRADIAGFPETRVRFMRSELLGRMGEREKSLAEFSKGLESKPVDALGYTVRGVARKGVDPIAALADFREAMKLDPRCFDAARNAANVLDEKMKDSRAAVAVLDEMLRKTSRDPLAWSGRAVLHARLGDVEQSRGDIAQALKLAPENGWVLYHAACAEMLLPNGNSEVALAMLAKALPRAAGAMQVVATDPDLGTLVESEAFKSVLAAAQTLSAAQAK